MIDHVEWNFLEGILLKLGFRRNWVKLIMMCVSTARYQIKINNYVTNTILPRHGLRQGGPLPPYLFLICAEGFSVMLREAENGGRLRGIKICNNAPSVSHLLLLMTLFCSLKRRKVMPVKFNVYLTPTRSFQAKSLIGTSHQCCLAKIPNNKTEKE